MIQGFRRFQPLQHGDRIEVPVVDGDDIVDKVIAPYYLVGAFSYRWPSREVVAECRRRDRISLLDPPGYTMQDEAKVHLQQGVCKCGIYITKKRTPGPGVNRLNYPVIAIVTGWGEFIEYSDDGWRVEYARIESMTVHIEDPWGAEVAEGLQYVYGVPVKWASNWSMCCERDHTNKLYKTADGREVPICKLPRVDVLRYWQLYEKMGINNLSLKERDELDREMASRI